MFTSTTSSPTPTATNGQTNWLQVAYGIGIATVVVGLVVGGIYLVIVGKRNKGN
jgi:hypothetical protein